jgi:hypothetical protein
MVSVLHVLLTLLKILGITILIILAILLAVLLLVLFVPVRYKAKGIFEGKNIDAGVNVTWLFNFLHFRAAYKYSEPLHLRLRVIGIPIYDNLKRGKKPVDEEDDFSQYEPIDNSERDKASEKANKPADEDDDDFSSYEPIKTADTQEDDTPEEDKPENGKNSETSQSDNKTITDTKVFTETDENSNKGKVLLDKIVDKIKSIYSKIKFTVEKIYGIIKKVKANFDYYVKLINLESTKAALRKCKKQIVKILKLLCPRKYKVNLHLGFEDPSTMGEVLAIWGMLYPFHMGKIDIRPEFDTAVMEGNFNVKGRICVVSIIKAACILYFDKDIRLLIRRLKRSTNN